MQTRRSEGHNWTLEHAPISWEHLKGPGSVAKLVRELAQAAPYRRDDQPPHVEDGFIVLFDPEQLLIAVAVLHAGAGRVALARDSIRIALEHQAGSIVLGLPRFGRALTENADFALASALANACDSLGMTLLDLVLVGASEYYSFRELGTLRNRPARGGEPALSSALNEPADATAR